MGNFLKKLLSLFLITNHLWIFSIAHANPLITQNQFYEQETSIGSIPVYSLKRDGDGYHLQFDNSLKNIEEEKQYFLSDAESSNVIGYIVRKGSGLAAFFEGSNIHVDETASDLGLHLQSDQPILLGNSLKSNTVAIAPSVRFKENFQTEHYVDVICDELNITDQIKAKGFKLTAKKQGLIDGKIITQEKTILEGHWENRGVIASVGDVFCFGEMFKNQINSKIFAGGFYLNSCEFLTEEGFVRSRLSSILSGRKVTLGRSFNYTGYSIGMTYEEANILENSTNNIKILVQNNALFRFDNLSGFDGHNGLIKQDNQLDIHTPILDFLRQFYEDIHFLKDTPEEEEKNINFITQSDCLLNFDLFAMQGFVGVFAKKMEIGGKLMHGENCRTILSAREEVLTFSSELGRIVEIIAPNKELQPERNAQDQEEDSILKVDQLLLHAEKLTLPSKTHITIPFESFITYIEDETIQIESDILPRSLDKYPHITLLGKNIKIFTNELYAKFFIAVAQNNCCVQWFDQIEIENGSLKAGAFDPDSYLFLEGEEAKLGCISADAPHKSFKGNLLIDHVVTQGKTLLLQGDIQGDQLVTKEESAVVLDAKLKLENLSAQTKTFIQTGESAVKSLVIDASKYVFVSQMFAQAAAISALSQNNLQAYIGHSNIQNLFMDVAKGSVLLKDVIAHNAHVLGKQFDAMGDLTVGHLAVNALSNIRIQRINVEKSLTLEAGESAAVSGMSAENAALHIAAQEHASVDHANLRGCRVDVTAQGVTSVENSDIQESLVQLKGQHVDLSKTTVEQSAVHAQGDVVHMTGNDIDASQITAQATRIALSENHIDHSTLQARATESVTVDQTTGTGNTFNIESDQVFMADNTLDQSRLHVKANRAYIDHLFGSYDEFQLKVNHLRLSGEASVQNGSIEGRDEGVLPYLDISERFKTHLQSDENRPRPSFVVKCQGYSNLHGLEVDGDGAMHLEAKDLTLRPDFTHLEGYAIYLDIAPKTHEDVIKLAQDLSRVANVEMDARDVVLMLESGRIYFSENLKLHLKGAQLNESTLEGAGNLSLITEHNIEMTKSFLSAKGELVAFAGGHLIRTGSKTYSGKGTSLISGGDMKDLAHVDTKEDKKTVRNWFFGSTTTTTIQKSTVCQDISDGSVLKFVGGDYEGRGAGVRAQEINLVFNGKFDINVAYDFWQEQRGNNYVRSKATPICSDFKGHVKIHVNGAEGGSIVAPKTDSAMEIIRDAALPPVKISLNLAKITEFAFDAWKSSSCCGLRKHHHQRSVTKEYYQCPELGGDVTVSGPLTLMYEKAIGHQHKESYGCFKKITREITDPLMTQENDYISQLKISPEQLEKIIVKELYKHDYHKQSHWSAAALMIVGISVALITGCVNFSCLGGQTIAQTAGASFASSIGCAGGAFATGFGAGITVAGISTASVALMQADGNPVKAIKSMLNAKTFGMMILSGVTCGACQWLGETAKLVSSVNNFAAPALNTVEGIQYAAMCGTINAGVAAAQGQDLVKTLAATAVSIGVQAIGANCLNLPNAEAIQVGLAATGGAISGAITGENPLLCGGASAAGAIMNLMTQDLKMLGISDNWQDAVKQIATVTVSGMAGLNPQYTAHGWQQAGMQINYNRAVEAELRKEKRLLEESIQRESDAEKVQQNKERIQNTKKVLHEKAQHLSKEEQAALEKTFDSIQKLAAEAEALSYKKDQSESASLQQSCFEDLVISGLSMDFDPTADSYVAQAIIKIDDCLDTLSAQFPNAAELLTKTLEGIGLGLDFAARVSVGTAGFFAGEAVFPTGGGLAGFTLAETAYDNLTSAASAGVEGGADYLVNVATQKWGPRAGQAVQKLITRGLIVVGAGGVIKGIHGLKVNPNLQTAAKNVKFKDVDYQIPGAEYSLRVDPITGKGPMGIDMTGMKPINGTTKLGHPRNAQGFWEKWMETYPGKLSEKNQNLISQKLSPEVDIHWIEHFPEHQKFLGQTIEHHHLDHGAIAYPLPENLHRRDGNYKMWHIN